MGMSPEDIAAHKQEMKERANKLQRDREFNNVAYFLVRNAKKRAKMKGIEFTITPKDIGEIPKLCPILGFPMEKQRGVFNLRSPSLDRVDSSRGYVPGNVMVISWHANSLKGALNIEQVQNLLSYMKGELNETLKGEADINIQSEHDGRLRSL